mmetsp:Transcript_1802/g.4149  ORF Transcript_1802/g.4149 Transcript_1802/m.4149 type:complete len:304 (-) Transcript_1802:1497-2408(-)
MSRLRSGPFPRLVSRLTFTSNDFVSRNNFKTAGAKDSTSIPTSLWRIFVAAPSRTRAFVVRSEFDESIAPVATDMASCTKDSNEARPTLFAMLATASIVRPRISSLFGDFHKELKTSITPFKKGRKSASAPSARAPIAEMISEALLIRFPAPAFLSASTSCIRVGPRRGLRTSGSALAPILWTTCAAATLIFSSSVLRIGSRSLIIEPICFARKTSPKLSANCESATNPYLFTSLFGSLSIFMTCWSMLSVCGLMTSLQPSVIAPRDRIPAARTWGSEESTICMIMAAEGWKICSFENCSDIS